MSYTHLDAGWILRIADGAHIPPDPANRDWSRDDEWFCSGLAVRVLNIGLIKPLYKDITRVTPQMPYLAVK